MQRWTKCDVNGLWIEQEIIKRILIIFSNVGKPSQKRNQLIITIVITTGNERYSQKRHWKTTRKQ